MATREVVPTRGNAPGRAKEPWALGRAGTVGGHDRDRPVRRTIMVANVEARRETDWPVHYPPTVAQYLGGVLVFAARRQANHRREGCMRVSA